MKRDKKDQIRRYLLVILKRKFPTMDRQRLNDVASNLLILLRLLKEGKTDEARKEVEKTLDLWRLETE